jgi:D-alanine--D-alanine ligase
MKKFLIGVLTGGPSAERGISLNSARSLLDHLVAPHIEIKAIYFDQKKRPFLLSNAQLYSNTPSDFDYYIASEGKPLSVEELTTILSSVDIVFPAIHGEFGEDGELQSLLEFQEIPYIGASSAACKKCFDKFRANEFIREKGFYALPSEVFHPLLPDYAARVRSFFAEHGLKKAIVKPASGGSSIGVYSVSTADEALERIAYLFQRGEKTRVVLEPHAEGIEFTVIILQNRFGIPTALIPTEIEADYQANQIFDYRKKYLPTRQVVFHCPPRFPDEVIEQIQIQAEQLFAAFGMHDCARFDGWVLEDGEIWFSDFNPISGMEQNSFLFQQGARVGLSHREILRYVVENSCHRQGIVLPPRIEVPSLQKQKVGVLFGGNTSERQVSLMSGTNVWLKLRQSEQYEPTPLLVENTERVWKIPYALLLNHTVEEILDACTRASVDESRLKRFEERIQRRLGCRSDQPFEIYFTPRRMELGEALRDISFAFIALHGGEGEDGTLQQTLESLAVPYNGSGPRASRLCMDKLATGKALSTLSSQGIQSVLKRDIASDELCGCAHRELESLWNELTQELMSLSLIVKPRSDGCSSGIVRLNSADELILYAGHLRARSIRIPPGTFKGQKEPVELPLHQPPFLLFEPFIETDQVKIVHSDIEVTPRSGWIEMTVGVLEQSTGLHALSPSITIAEGEVLTVEEKFQGGTGVNLTPPPAKIVAPHISDIVKHKVALAAKTLGIEGYARLDVFVERATGALILIEANSLPALTPSTVLFHQGLSENAPLFPLDLLEALISAGVRRSLRLREFT